MNQRFLVTIQSWPAQRATESLCFLNIYHFAGGGEGSCFSRENRL